MGELKIEDWDDRSGTDGTAESFGFVYFSDGARVGYAPGLSGQPPVWQPRTNGGGQFREITEEHLTLARAFLEEKGVM